MNLLFNNSKSSDTTSLHGLTVGFLILLSVFAFSQIIIFSAYAVLMIWSLFGVKHSIKALSVNFVILLLNPAIYSLPNEISIMRWAIILVAGFRVLPFASIKLIKILFPLILFFIMVVALSWTVSPKFSISFLKISIFTYYVSTVIVAFESFELVDLNDLCAWFGGLIIAVFILSLPTLMIHNVGYFTNGRGFQGILNQPQAYAVFIVPIVAFLLCNLLLTKSKNGLLSWLFLVLLIIILYLTCARTAMLALLLSLGFTYIVCIVRSGKIEVTWTPYRCAFIVIGMIVLVSLIVLISPQFNASLNDFVYKGSKDDVGEAFYHSRGGGMAFQWKRFLENPLTGNGFGIDVAHGNENKPSVFLGIPISASTEKGFLPVAFVEEVGLLGFIFFIPFFTMLVKKAICNCNVGLISMFFSCLFVNIGEAVFFSPGQLGGYLWLLIGLATASGWQKTDET